MMKARQGMALAVTIGLVSLISILAVATLSLAGRMLQNSTLSLRDAQLDAAVASGLTAAADEWRSRNLGRLAVGSSISFGVAVPNVPVAVTTTVTRVGTEVFWVVSDAVGRGGAERRENLLLRFRVPGAAALIEEDTTNVETLDFVVIDSVAADADLVLPSGSTLRPPSGTVHVKGDATLLGGVGDGVLIVDGRLAIVEPVTFTGVIIVRGGISVGSPNVVVTGLIRAAGDPPLAGSVTMTVSQAVVQDVVTQALTPSLVSGRRWAEMF